MVSATVGQCPTHIETVTLHYTLIAELSTCQYRDFKDRYFAFVDRILIASSLTDCQRKCDSEQSFHCKAVNFDPISRECSLSSEDSAALLALHSPLSGVASSLDTSIAPVQQDSIFSEKGNCEQGKCLPSAAAAYHIK